MKRRAFPISALSALGLAFLAGAPARLRASFDVPPSPQSSLQKPEGN